MTDYRDSNNIDPNGNYTITQLVKFIREKMFGIDVRESIAKALEKVYEDVVSVTGRQATVEEQFQSVLDETTGKDVISAPEIIVARNGEADLKTRLDKEKQEVTAQLATISTNVILFGAKGDGVTDDTQAIKIAIAFIKSVGGGKIWFPKGRYKISGDIVVPSNVILEGMGIESEIFTDVYGVNIFVSEINAVSIQIIKLRIVGSGFGTQPANSNSSQIVSGAGSGIIFIGVKNGSVVDCIIENCGGDGSSSEKNGVAGIWLTYGSKKNIVRNNTVINCRNGINEDNFFYRDAEYNLIDGNIVESCRFGIATETDYGKGCKIINNTILNCLYSGIDINRSSNVLVSGNYIEGCGNTGVTGVFAAAIHSYGNVFIRQDDVIIVDNILKDNYGNGIKIAQNTNNVVARGNTITGCKNGIGIAAQASIYLLIAENIIRACQGDGIYLGKMTVGSTDVMSNHAIIKANIIIGCLNHGINLDEVSFASVTENRINDNNKGGSSNGINLKNNSSNNSIVNNIVTRLHQYGIATIDALSINNVIMGNIVSDALINKYGFANSQQYLANNADYRSTSSQQMAGSVDLKTNSASLYLKSTNGKPTGAVSAEIVVDIPNNKLWINFAGTWKAVTFPDQS